MLPVLNNAVSRPNRAVSAGRSVMARGPGCSREYRVYPWISTFDILLFLLYLME
jgi:hypothetical protein